MRVRLVSDGKPCGTRVYNADTGEDISDNIVRVEFRQEHTMPDPVGIWFRNVEVEVTGEAEVHEHKIVLPRRRELVTRGE
jgi:hypothetical protein